MLLRIQKQGLDVIPKILIVSSSICSFAFHEKAFLMLDLLTNEFWFKVTRFIPDAKGTTCNQRLERISGTEHTSILRVPFRTENGILKKWISRFDVWPYLETFAEVKRSSIAFTCYFFFSELYLPRYSLSASQTNYG